MKKQIIEILKDDARLSPSKIARMLGKSTKEVMAQIKELEKKKVILKYKAVINWEKVNDDIVSAIIEVKVTPQRGRGFDAVAERIYKFPEVRSMYLASGEYDFLIIVEGKGLKEVAFFVAEKLATLEQVRSTATHFLLKCYKEDGDILDLKEEPERIPVSP